MNLWFRLVRVLVRALLAPRLGFLDESVVEFRVLPTDLDVNVHMNNARYLSMMDLGRFDLIIRTGMLKALLRGGYRPVLSSVLLRFRRPLRPFERFRVRSRVIGWDERRAYMEQLVEADGVIACRAINSAAFLQGGRTAAPAEFARFAGSAATSPPLPLWIAEWQDVETAIAQDVGTPRAGV